MQKILPRFRRTIHYANCILYKIKAGFMFYCLLLLMILLVFSLVKPNKDTVVARVQGTTMLVIVLFGLVLLKSKYAVFL